MHVSGQKKSQQNVFAWRKRQAQQINVWHYYDQVHFFWSSALRTKMAKRQRQKNIESLASYKDSFPPRGVQKKSNQIL